jgi:NHLM bacteriocin system ABC transporter ATP-binding protein
MKLQQIDAGLRQIKGNQPLLLNDPQTVWLVQSGSLALFAVPIKNGEAEGDRHYLFNIYPGEALFGIAVRPDCNSLGMIAVPLESTELLPIAYPPTSTPSHSCTQPSPPNLQSLLDTWIHKLGQVEGLPQPKTAGIAPQMQYISLMEGQICQPPQDQVLWVRVQQGKMLWLGHSDLVLEPETGCFPIGNGAWLEAANHLELFSRGTADVDSWTVLLRGLAQLHHYFLRSVELIGANETQQTLARFEARQQLNRQLTQQTIHQLASVLNPTTESFFEADAPLLIAAGAVGKALGVTIQPPARSEDLKRLKEPLEAIARSSRLRLRRVLLRSNWWKMDSGPLLAYTVEGKRPVALLPVGNAQYELFDPVRAGLAETDVPTAKNSRPVARIPVDQAVAQTIDPVAFVFYRPLPDGLLNAISLLKFTLQGRTSDVIAILLTGVAATLLGMLVPQATAVLIDNAIPYGNSGLLVQIGLGLLAAAFGGASFQLAQAIASMRIETLSDASLQAAVWDRLLKLKTSFFREYSIGDLNSRVSGIGTIRRKLSGTALQSIFTGFFSLLNLGLLFYYSSKLAILALLLATVIVTFTTISGSLIIRKNRPLMELEGDIFGLMVQLINAVPKLRIAGVEERAFAHWGQRYVKQLQLLATTQRLEDTVVLFNTVLPTLTTVMLFGLASTLIDPTQSFGSGSGLSTGSFLAFSVAFGTFIGGVTSLSNTLIEVLDVIPLWQRSQPILTAQPEIDLNKANPGRLSGNVQIDHISFRYREDGPLNLDDVCISAQPGEFIALVGPSGSGKSTVMRLLLGFESPISGTVYYDGQDLMGLDVMAVRRQLGVVLQNSRINAGSIFENIASGALITLDEAWTAAEMSGFAEDVRAMPMQMHTLVSEGGTNLSGGQRQRLVIARALALKPQILLFDEATSALDNKTQAIVSQSLDQLKVTRVVIAHRLSTIRYADRIYVMQAGRVVQQGCFEELVNQPGLFAQLARRQLTSVDSTSVGVKHSDINSTI